ncbi:hypothetical protein [Caulobacter sp. 1776]
MRRLRRIPRERATT